MSTNEEISPKPPHRRPGDLGDGLLDEAPEARSETEGRPILRELRRAMELFDKADKAYKIYPINNVLLNEFIDRAFGAFRTFLDENGSIQLSVTPTELRFEKETIFTAEIRETSLPFKLYEGGLRLLGFFPGLERAEMVSFLEVMKALRHVDEDEDNVVTLLWEKDVAHITYLVMDREADTATGEVDKIPDPSVERSEMVKRIKLRDVSQRVDDSEIDQDLLPSEETTVPVEKIYGLSEEDKKGTEERLAFEQEYIPIYDFVTLLFRIFRMERDWDTFYELSQILEKILGVLATRGDYRVCASILEEMEEFLDSNPDLSDDHRQVFWDVVTEVGSAHRVEEAASYLAEATPEEADTIFDFLKHLGPTALPNLCNVIEEQHEQQFMDLIGELGRDNPTIVADCLGNTNPLVVRTMLRILASDGATKALGAIAALLDHGDSAIRLQAVDTLAGTGEAKAGQMLMSSLEDPDAQVRKTALRQMVRLVGERAFGPILRKIESKDFITRPFYEKRELMVNACKADPARGVPLLRRMLERSSFFQREKNKETRQCAAMALGELGTLDALEVLRDLQKSKNRVVRDACRLSLKKAEGGEVTRRLI